MGSQTINNYQENSSASQLLQLLLHTGEVGVDVKQDWSERREDIMQLFPKGLHYAPHKPCLVLVDALYCVHLEDFCYLVAALLLLAGDLAEFVAEKRAP